MELGLGSTLLAGDQRLIDHIVGEVKSQGIFDQFRKECIADVDTKPAYQNLRTRVESSVNSFLGKQVWKADLNKNQLRETLRKHIHDAPYLDAGVERIVDQVVNPKVYSVFMPQIEDVVYKFLGIERPRNYERNGGCGLKDLLPKDLDPVSPESDKNSLRDVSLDSVDGTIDEETRHQDSLQRTNTENNSGDDKKSVRLGEKNCGVKDEEKSSEEISKSSVATPDCSTMNHSGKTDDKGEEEEEDSPMFEPIDIMNLNESNISNDSHLSGISELTSHRSRSPDFSNETSRENMDFSNQDSQLSKVSSDSRLSIVTDFGSSNHASTPLSDVQKDDRDRNEVKCSKDNFKIAWELEMWRGKEVRTCAESVSCKEEVTGTKKSSGWKETSRDATETSKDCRDAKDKSHEVDSSRSKGTKEREERSKSRSESKISKVKRSKERTESTRESGERSRDSSVKVKENKHGDTEKKDIVSGGEVKDLKDIYKEKIRELREKKELEKEKFTTDSKASEETKEKRDSSREGRKSFKDQKGAPSKSSSRTEVRSTKSESRSSMGKRDDRKYTKDHRSKSSSQRASDSGDKIDSKRLSRSEKDDKTEKCESKLDSRPKSSGKSSKTDQRKNSETSRDGKNEMEARDKKRRDDKKSKIKDDHSSLRKNYDDRRSTDRDGSNGSNGKSSHKNNSGSNSATGKPVSSSLSKDSTTTTTTTTTGNTSTEISDVKEMKRGEKLTTFLDTKESRISGLTAENSEPDGRETLAKRLDLGQNEKSLPIKKRPLTSETAQSVQTLIKKPKFAKNFQEAKRLMKIRRKMEKENTRRQMDMEKSEERREIVETVDKIVKEDLRSVPDEERVQIIEVRDEEYDEPYPEIQSDFTLEERSQIILGGDSIFTSDVIANRFNTGSTLSEMELSIRRSLKEMMSDNRIDEGKNVSIGSQSFSGTDLAERNDATPRENDNSSSEKPGEEYSTDALVTSSKSIDNDETSSSKSVVATEIVMSAEIPPSSSVTLENEKPAAVFGSECEIERVESRESTKNMESPNSTMTDGSVEAIGESGNLEESTGIERTMENRGEIEAMAGKVEQGGRIEKTAKIEDSVEEGEEIGNIIDKEQEQHEQSLNITIEPVKIADEIVETKEIPSNAPKVIDNIGTVMKIEEEETKNSEDMKQDTKADGVDGKDAKIDQTSGNETVTCKKMEEEAKVIEIVEEKANVSDAVEERAETNEITEESTSTEGQSIETIASVPPSDTLIINEAELSELGKNAEETCNKSLMEPEERAKTSSSLSDDGDDDEAPCLYFVQNTEKLEKFTMFLKSLEIGESSSEEQQTEIPGSEISSSASKPMAPPKPKRKYSTSPLTDILLNNTNNNNDAHKNIDPISDAEDSSNSMKKRKIGRPKKQRNNASLCGQQNLSNGENFVMPLSPESDVSATSEKPPSNPIKDDKSRPRGSNQRYTSDDLYKPRPLFSSSSRRSRRSNQP